MQIVKRFILQRPDFPDAVLANAELNTDHYKTSPRSYSAVFSGFVKGRFSK
jgi:hypothetical protein